MKILQLLYDGLINLCAAIASIILVALVAIVVASVVGRAMNLYTLRWASAVSEYGLQFATMLAAPLILRKKGHTFLVFAHQGLPPKASVVLEKLVYLLCLTLSAGFTYFATIAAWQAYATCAVDIRSIDIPGWVLYVSLILGFGLMGVEFARYLFGRASMFDSTVEHLQ